MGQGGIGQNALWDYYEDEGDMIHAGDGGGGGYYGGGASGNKDLSGTGGGSSYISGHEGCVAHSSGKNFTDTLMIDGRGYKWTTSVGPLQQMPNPSGGYYSFNVGHTGMGYAKISTIAYLSSNSIYTWSKNPVKAMLTINYVDENGNILKTSDVNEFLAEETYITNAPTSFENFDNYELISTPSNATGILSVEGTTVNYIYRLKSSNVIVHHYLEGSTISIDGAPDEILSGKITNSYTTDPKNIEKYELISTPSNATGLFTSSIQEVIYYYRLRSTSNLHVIHKLDSGNILNTDTKSGYVGNPYSTDSRIYENYELKTTPNNANGIYEEENEDVIYIYTLKSGGVITVHHYLEGTTTSIEGGSDQTLTGKITKSYTTSSVTNEDYNLVSTPSNANGIFTSENQVVTYYYRIKVPSNVVVLYKTESGNILNRSDLVGIVGNNYETTEQEFENYILSEVPTNKNGIYTEEPQEVIYVYTLKEGEKVTVHHYIKDTTTSVSDDVVLTGKITEPYISKSVSIESYKLIETPSNAIGTFTDVKQTVTYYYEEKTPTIIEIVYVDTSGKILDEKKEDGYIGDEYTSEEKKFENYELLNVSDNWHGTLQENNEKVYYTYSLVQNPKTGIGNTLWISLTVIILGIFTYLYVSKKQIFNI